MIPLPTLGASIPRTHGALTAGFGRWALTIAGWRIEARFIAKHSLFWWPLGAFLRAVGGIAVFDYRRKVVQLGPAFAATGDYEGDLAAMQAHISAAMAKHPARYGQDRGLK